MNRAMSTSAALILALGLVVGATYGQVASKGYAQGVVAADGSIHVPENFRTDYVMLGAWSVTGDADTAGDIGLHVVYARLSEGLPSHIPARSTDFVYVGGYPLLKR